MRHIAGPVLAALFAVLPLSPTMAQSMATLQVKNGSGTTVSIAGQYDVLGYFHYRDIMEGLDNSGNPRPLLTDTSGNLFSLPLPTGAATSANQITTYGYLATLAGAVNAGTFQVVNSNPAAIFTGQIKIATTGTAVCLPTKTLVNGVVIKAFPTNVANAAIGSSAVTNTLDGTGNGYVIAPGEAAPVAIPQASNSCVNGTAGDAFTYIGN